MRTLLALASVTLLVAGGFGCGDDTTTTTAADLAMTPADMSMPHDMMQLNCLQILCCASNCTTQACVGSCVSEGKSASQAAAGKLLQCAAGACQADGGVDAGCVAQTIMAALSGSGPCVPQGTTCKNDM